MKLDQVDLINILMCIDFYIENNKISEDNYYELKNLYNKISILEINENIKNLK